MKYGHFDVKRREYVIDRVDVPVSWTNYLGVEELCAVVNHTAGGYLFYQSPEHHRITRFRPNGVPMDRPGHYLYLRDDETGEYWSVSWQPCGGPVEAYRCRHGLSYSVYECARHGIEAAQTLFIPRGENTELWDLALENASGRPRSLSVYSYAEFAYHQIPIDNQNFQMSLYCAGSDYADGIIDYELFYEHAHQFMAACGTASSAPTARRPTPSWWSGGRAPPPSRRATTTAPCCKRSSPWPPAKGSG